MLRLILDRAGPAIPPETMFITDFADVWHRGGLDDHEAAVELTRRVWRHPRVQLWNLGGDPELPPAGLVHREAFRWAVEQPYLAYMRREGKTWWADKTPPHIDHVDLLADIFPGAKFIELVRDGRDVVLSIMGLPFGGNNVWTTARRWAHCVRRGQQARVEHPDDVLLVRYEEIVHDPAVQVRRVSEFLGIEYDDDMLRVEDTDASKLQADQAGWFTNLWGGINTNAVGKWRTKMSTRDQAIFLAAAGPELAIHGYADNGVVAAQLGAPARAWFEVSNFARRLVNLIKLRIITERGRELRWVLRRRLVRR